jgi:hypothetical protein
VRLRHVAHLLLVGLAGLTFALASVGSGIKLQRALLQESEDSSPEDGKAEEVKDAVKLTPVKDHQPLLAPSVRDIVASTRHPHDHRRVVPTNPPVPPLPRRLC